MGSWVQVLKPFLRNLNVSMLPLLSLSREEYLQEAWTLLTYFSPA